MPAISLPESWIEVVVHETASDFLTATSPSLCKRESAANIILPHALETLAFERDVTHIISDTDAQPRPTRISKRFGSAHRSADDFWLTCWSLREGEDPVLDLVLSCTSGSFGSFPIFFYSNISRPEASTQEFLEPRVRTLIESLLATVPITRVFSVFGPAPLVKNFSEQWSYITGQQQEPEPLYAATFSYATRETLAVPLPLPSGDCMRRASFRDANAVGQLLKEFADSSVYYPLSYEQSLQEAMKLIRERQVWLYETCGGQIPSVVAVTRSSPNVAAITKVFTTPVWRKRGYGERLVSRVTRELLYGAGKQRVLLYVSHGNAAAKVYRRVGFMGLDRKDVLEDIDEWLEIGFRRTHRGHW